jgi:hypothetical protein
VHSLPSGALSTLASGQASGDKLRPEPPSTGGAAWGDAVLQAVRSSQSAIVALGHAPIDDAERTALFTSLMRLSREADDGSHFSPSRSV